MEASRLDLIEVKLKPRCSAVTVLFLHSTASHRGVEELARLPFHLPPSDFAVVRHLLELLCQIIQETFEIPGMPCAVSHLVWIV